VLKRAIAKEGEYDESCDLWSLGVILYTMLSGKAPFQSSSRDSRAPDIMHRIRGGEFSMEGQEWKMVSEQAKKIIKGLLTVDVKHRLTMNELQSSEWIKGNTNQFSGTPLVTPDVLSFSKSSVTTVKTKVNATMDAFHKAHRQGFRLQDVNNAPLAQRRKKKKSSAETRSSSSDSAHSHGSLTPTKGLTNSPLRNSPARNSPVRNLSNNSQSSTTSTGFTPLGIQSAKQVNLESSGFFSFRENKIASLMATMSKPHPLTEDTTSQVGPFSSISQKTGLSTVFESRTSPIPQASSSADSSSYQSQKELNRGTKRPHIDTADDSDDDCIIIEEESSGLRRGSDIANNNSAKRPRCDTIVIE